MTAFGNEVLSTENGNKILMDNKCGKCNKVVRNGILCENCDKWFHFNKCSEVSKDNLPKNNVWVCVACSTNGVIENGRASPGQETENELLKLRNEIASLKEIISLINKDQGTSQPQQKDTTWSDVVKGNNGRRRPEINRVEMYKTMLRCLTITSVKCFRGNVVHTASYSSQAPKVAVVLSGSGVYDGSEIHEASSVLVHLTREGAVPQCYAPDVPQMHVINHIKGSPEEKEKRNVLAESARIARGQILPLSQLSSGVAQAVVFPGGFGAAKNLSDFAVNGVSCKVNEDVVRVLKDFHKSKKPIGLCCIAPVLAAKVLNNVTVTLGKKDDGKGKWPHAGAIDAACEMGANVVSKDVNEIAFDDKNLIVTTPAFMYEGQFHEIYDGIGNMIKKVVQLIK